MNGLHRQLFYGFCVLFVLLSGCVSTEVGDARYQNNGIQVSVNSSSAMPDAFMQVTIYEVKGLQQQESGKPDTGGKYGLFLGTAATGYL
jgi:hypothetical protein